MLVVVIVTSVPGYARMVRTRPCRCSNTEFITGRALAGRRRLAHHVLATSCPTWSAPLLILGSMDIPVVITIEAGLSFLGLGVLPPTPCWGSILNDGYSSSATRPGW